MDHYARKDVREHSYARGSKIKTLKTRKTWEAPTEQDEQIIALKVRLEKLKKNVVQTEDKVKKRENHGAGGTPKKKKNK